MIGNNATTKVWLVYTPTVGYGLIFKKYTKYRSQNISLHPVIQTKQYIMSFIFFNSSSPVM